MDNLPLSTSKFTSDLKILDLVRLSLPTVQETDSSSATDQT
jgi:hypothetical protein